MQSDLPSINPAVMIGETEIGRQPAKQCRHESRESIVSCHGNPDDDFLAMDARGQTNMLGITMMSAELFPDNDCPFGHPYGRLERNIRGKGRFPHEGANELDRLSGEIEPQLCSSSTHRHFRFQLSGKSYLFHSSRIYSMKPESNPGALV